jgi:hypothetical protein
MELVMARYAIIENGTVQNVALSESALEANWIESETAGIGWTWDAVTGFTPSAPSPAPQITSLSFAQLVIGLVAEDWITEAEGEGWLVGTLPAPVLALIASLPEGQRFAVKARASRFTVAYLDDPMVQALAAAQGKSAELPAFFNTYGVA